MSLKERDTGQRWTERDTGNKTEREKQAIQESEMINPIEKSCQNLNSSGDGSAIFSKEKSTRPA